MPGTPPALGRLVEFGFGEEAAARRGGDGVAEL
jgi:hypothetical protein